MDIAKYIGLFLLKNNQCFIHGLGNLVLRRKPASYDGESLHSWSYEISIIPATTIDDTLANYIATNEQISISKATNALKEFSANAKEEMKAGRDVPIFSLGKFSEHGGKVSFITDPHLQFARLPILASKNVPIRPDERRAPQQPAYQEHAATTPPTPPPVSSYTAEPPPYEDEGGSRLNWGRIIITLLIFAIVVAGIYFVYKKFYQEPRDRGSRVLPSKPLNEFQNMPSDSATMDNGMDTTAAIDTTLTSYGDTIKFDNKETAAVPEKKVRFKLILNTYAKKEDAEKRYRQLSSYGNKVEMVEEDAETYFVIMPVSAPAKDTADIIDSIRVLFNPDGVFVY